MSANSTCYLSLGSNLGAREKHLQTATVRLAGLKHTSVTAESSCYQTQAWGPVAQNDFLNKVVRVKTALPPLQLLFYCQRIEQEIGHPLRPRFGPRQIDIDILLVDNNILSFEALQIPHPRMLQRHFVIWPLHEIVPELILPNGQPLQAIRDSLAKADYLISIYHTKSLQISATAV